MLEDSLRWVEWFPMRSPFEDADYSTERREGGVDWRWVDAWEAEHPSPGPGENWLPWYAELVKMRDRCWVAWCFPEFRVLDWSEKDVALARKLVSRHICGVCGRRDDSGCAVGC